MTKINKIFSLVLALSAIIILSSWAYYLEKFFRNNPLYPFLFIYYKLPPLIICSAIFAFFLIYFIKKQKTKPDRILKRSHKIVISSAALISLIISFALPYANMNNPLMQATHYVENKDFLRSLSVETCADSNIVPFDKQFDNSDRSAYQIGNSTYLKVEYKQNMDVRIGRAPLTDEKYTTVDCEMYFLKDVPKFLLKYENSAFEDTYLLLKMNNIFYKSGDLSDYDYKSSRSNFSCNVFYRDEKAKQLIAFGKSNNDFIIYKLIVQDDYETLTFDENSIIQIIDNVLSGNQDD